MLPGATTRHQLSRGQLSRPAAPDMAAEPRAARHFGAFLGQARPPRLPVWMPQVYATAADAALDGAERHALGLPQTAGSNFPLCALRTTLERRPHRAPPYAPLRAQQTHRAEPTSARPQQRPQKHRIARETSRPAARAPSRRLLGLRLGATADVGIGPHRTQSARPRPCGRRGAFARPGGQGDLPDPEGLGAG